MKTFRYRAIGCEGQSIYGEVIAANEVEAREEVAKRLEDETHIVVDVEEIED